MNVKNRSFWTAIAVVAASCLVVVFINVDSIRGYKGVGDVKARLINEDWELLPAGREIETGRGKKSRLTTHVAVFHFTLDIASASPRFRFLDTDFEVKNGKGESVTTATADSPK